LSVINDLPLVRFSDKPAKSTPSPEDYPMLSQYFTKFELFLLMSSGLALGIAYAASGLHIF
jgi:hypothetical protein